MQESQEPEVGIQTDPRIGTPEWYAQYNCEKCGKLGVTEAGMDTFVASLCQGCFDRLWKEYISAVTGREVSDAGAKELYAAYSA